MNWDLVKQCTTPVRNSRDGVIGTAFFISSDGLLLTCAHIGEVAGGWDQVRIQAQQINVIYSGASNADDFAVLQLGRQSGSAAIISTSLTPMDRFLSMGYGRPDFPFGASVDGVITDINPQSNFGDLPMIRLRITADAQQIREGYSGAPVYNAETDCIVGIVAAYDHTEGALAVPLSTVLNKWPSLVKYLNKSNPLPSVQLTTSRRVFISYRSEDPDVSFAQQLFETFKTNGHQPFMAGESLKLGDEWPNRISGELEASDYFLLLLSPKSAKSDMVTEEVKRARHLYDTRPDHRPRILPIRLNMDLAAPLNYDLAGYLSRFQQKVWNSESDTLPIIQELLAILSDDKPETLSRLDVPVQRAASETAGPLPVAEPELPEGQVKVSSLFYINRPPLEEICNREILKPGALIRIRAPRQMGKTSLLARILDHAKSHNYSVIPISLQLTDGNLVNDLGRLLKWLSAYVGRKMQLPNKVTDYWDDILGHKSSATAYFEDYLLPNINTPLVLALDEVDRLFENEQVASDFFGMLRGWHESAKDQALWAKLRLIIVHSTEVYISLGIKESPFNVGLSVRPVEFTSSQIDDLSNRHGYSISPENAHNLMELVGGHPYLSRVALFAWSRGDLAPESFFKTAATEQGLYSDHLRRYIWNLQQNTELLNAMKRVIAAAPRPVDVEAMDAFKLESMGLIAREGNGVKMRFRLYELYLRERLNRVH